VVADVRLTAAVTREGPLYVARCLEVEVASQGRSFDEAMANLKEALELFFEDHPKTPEVAPPIIAPVEVSV
jgi:predicted RNase H-like HicB family nuclease